MRCQAKLLEQRTGRSATKWRNDMLSAKALEALIKMRSPASPSDRPGDWSNSPIEREFGKDAVAELLSSGLVQRGGVPAPVPAEVAARFADNMRSHRALVKTHQLYPALDHILFITKAGWRHRTNGPDKARERLTPQVT
jgi:hypothetical protein